MLELNHLPENSRPVASSDSVEGDWLKEMAIIL